MPYNRPGRGVYVVAPSASTTAILHGQPINQDGFTGVTVKQKAAPWESKVVDAKTIGPSEGFFLISKGVVTVAAVNGLTNITRGSKVWVHATDASAASVASASANWLVNASTNASTVPFGVVTEIVGKRGAAASVTAASTDFVRVDLDARDQF